MENFNGYVLCFDFDFQPNLPPGSPTLNEVFLHYQKSAPQKKRLSLPVANGTPKKKKESSSSI